MFRSSAWIRISVVSALMIMAASVGAADAPAAPKSSGFHIGPMEIVLLLTSVAGFALALQALVTMRSHLLRPPGLVAELQDLVREGNLEGAFDAAQGDTSLLGAVATATLANVQYGKEAMEGAMGDAGEVEGNKLLNKIGILGLIAAIAPMLGLTGTTLGMMGTFETMGQGGEITADKMAVGIKLALQCTFLGLMVAIPLLVLGYFLKARVTQIILEVATDCGELVRIITSGEQQPAE